MVARGDRKDVSNVVLDVQEDSCLEIWVVVHHGSYLRYHFTREGIFEG